MLSRNVAQAGHRKVTTMPIEHFDFIQIY